MIRFLYKLPARIVGKISASIAAHARNVATAFVQIGVNKGRAFLTTVGIIIAVTSTIIVVSFVQGFGDYVTQMVRGYGTQFMVVHPWYRSRSEMQGMRAVKLTLEDVEAVRTGSPTIHRISQFIYAPDAEVKYGDETASEIPLRGVTEQYQTIRNFYVDKGRFFGPVDVENAASVIVMGRTLLKHLETDDSIVGHYVQLNDYRFKVVGLLEAKGNMMGEDQDETMMIPYTTALRLYPDRRESVSFLAESASEDKINETYGDITRILRLRHDLGPGMPNDFRINRQDQALKQFEQIRNIASGILAGIVSISLVVGGIGIMNIMLVSVTERTREIGLRKSIGGRRRDIMLQFLTEAVVLCVLGGAIGVVIGYAVTYVASLHPQMVPVTVPLWAVALALATSAGAGVVFGIVPAFKAAILHPIDALRHE